MIANMLILIACECSGKVRDAFLKKGHEVYSCDLQPCKSPGPHFQQSVLPLLSYRWDMLIGFPPCTYLTTAGARWWNGNHPNHTPEAQQAGFNFFMLLMRQHHIPRIALENPARGKINEWFRPPTQVIQPWHHGEPYTKATGLWLKNLPKLTPTQIVPVPEKFVYARDIVRNPRIRSLTFNGIARAMANQWGDLPTLS